MSEKSSPEIKTRYRVCISFVALLDAVISIRVLHVISPEAPPEECLGTYVIWIFNACHLSLSLLSPLLLACSSCQVSQNYNVFHLTKYLNCHFIIKFYY